MRPAVLFISSAEQPGADTFVNMLVMRALDRARFDVHLACPPPDASGADPYARWIDANVHVRRCRFGPSLTRQRRGAGRIAEGASGFATLVSLARYIRRHRIGIVHASDRPRDAVACRLLAVMTGARSVIHVHVKYDDWVGAPVRWALRHAEAVIGVSRFVADTLVRGGYSAERTHAVLNAIEVERWTTNASGASVRREFGIAMDAPVLLCAARLFHWKGQAQLVRAVAALRAEFPAVRLLVVGEDYRLADGESYLTQLKSLVRDLGVEEHVIFTGHRTDMPELMAACDVFALPSFEEPFGLVFAEAMASRRPVIALQTGGVAEVVEHGRTGLLSPPGDLEALCANVATLLRDAPLRARMGEYARSVVERNFTPSRLAADVERIYASIWPERRRRRLLVQRHV